MSKRKDEPLDVGWTVEMLRKLAEKHEAEDAAMERKKPGR